MTNPTPAAGTMATTTSTAPNIWRTPEISSRWWPVFLRNLLVWRKLAIPSLVGNIAERPRSRRCTRPSRACRCKRPGRAS